ncbi:hypothetical protein M9Y10_010487 [Tritrichomonas musculus]|uniref:Uncharacterized protein n=1 Tax=Tritrichomonas musculus TaxID=1915356 RepID=A0ABR2IL24_9EUKA
MMQCEINDILMLKGFPNIYDDLDSFPTVLGNIITDDSINEINDDSSIIDSTKAIKVNINNIDKDKINNESKDDKIIISEDFKNYFEFSNDNDDKGEEDKVANMELIESKQKEAKSYSSKKISKIISNVMNNTECAEENTYA